VPQAEQPKVVVVEDEEQLADLYSVWLADSYAVQTAYSGDEGLDLIDTETEVVLLDRRMPGLTGDETLKEIRQYNYGCRVVMVTAVDPDFDIMELAIDDYIIKPVEREQLRDAVERAVTIGNYNDQIQELSSLKLRRNVLEVENEDTYLERNEEYQRLVSEVEALEAEIKEKESELDLENIDLML